MVYFTQRRDYSSFYFCVCLPYSPDFAQGWNDRRRIGRVSKRNGRAIGSRSWSRDICYYLSIGAMILLFVEKVGKVLRTFFFCKTKVISFRGEEEAKFFCCKPTFLGRIFFVDDLDYDRGPEASFSERELIFVGKKVVARTRTEIDRSNGRPPLSKNYAFHQRTTNDLFFSFLAETC